METRKMIVGMIVVVFVLMATWDASNEYSIRECAYAAREDNMPRVPAGHDFTKVAADANYAPGELIVRFAAGPGGKRRTVSERKQILRGLGGGTLKRNFRIVPGLSLVKLPEGLTVEAALKKFNGSAGILYAEPNYRVKVVSALPNDERFDELWGLHNLGQQTRFPCEYDGVEDCDIDAPEGWEITTGDPNIIVAVIDTGVDYNHPDLAANMWTNSGEQPGDWNSDGRPGVAGVDDDGDGLIDEDSNDREPNDPNYTNDLVNDDDENGYNDDIYGYDFCTYGGKERDSDPMDDHDHGTHCSGTIGAVSNNNEGVTGVCWNVKIMALKFLASSGYGYNSDAIACIEYSVLMGANLSNNSWGGGGYNQSLKDAIDEAGAAGLLFMASAGNESCKWGGYNIDEYPIYPASYNCASIIAVLATDNRDKLACFSNYGPTSVDVGAPGCTILSCKPGGSYQNMFGTSMATPHVSGACALMWSKYPNLTFQEMKDILFDSVDAKTGLSNKCVSGGRLNIAKALRYPFNSNTEKCYETIQGAIDDANDGDEIVLYPGIYNEYIDYKGKAITVRGIASNDWGAVAATVIDADGATRAVDIDANGTLNGLTITGGTYGVYCDSANPTISKCIIEDNSSAGVYCNGGSPKIENNKIFNNSSYGINCITSPVTIKNNLIYHNGNSGVRFEGQTAGTPLVRNNTVAYNTTRGIWRQYGYSTQPEIINCIVWGNGVLNLANCSATYSCVEQGEPREGNIYDDPQFCDADSNDYHLGSDSPCIDAGDPNGTYTGEFDIDFAVRLYDGDSDGNSIVDMGADEVGYPLAHWKMDDNAANPYVASPNGPLPTGPELVTNGGFGYDGSWTKQPGWTIGSGVAKFTESFPAINGSIYQTIDISAGHTYSVRFTITDVSPDCVSVKPIVGGTGGTWRASTTDTYYEIITAGSSDSRIKFYASAMPYSGYNVSIDNASVVCFDGFAYTGIFYDENGNPNTNAHDTTGKIDGALTFDGVDDYVNCGTGGSLDVTGAITIGAWVKRPNFDTSGVIAGKTNGNSVTAGYGLFSYADGLEFNFYSGGWRRTTPRVTIPANEWHHVVGTFDGSDAYLYVDGNQSASLTYSGTIAAATGYSFHISYWRPSIPAYFDGAIDDVLIYDRALSVEEIKELYTEGYVEGLSKKAFGPYPEDGAEGIDPNVVLSWTAGYGAASHDVYFGTDFSDVSDADTGSPEYKGNQTENSYDPDGLEYETPYNWRIDEVEGPNVWKGDVWGFTVREPNLIGFWKFDEDEGRKADDSASGNDGTVYGADWTDGQIDGALSFDANWDWVSLGRPMILVDLPLNDMTVCAWIRDEQSLNTWGNIAGCRNFGSNGWSFATHTDPNGEKSLRFYLGYTHDYTIKWADYWSSYGTISQDTWHHVASVWDGSTKTAKLYIDANEPSYQAQTPGIGTYREDFSCYKEIGRSPNMGGQHYFKGKIDDVRIYNRELSAAEIEQLYQEGL